MYHGQKALRENLKAKTEALIAVPYAQQALKDAAQKWLDTYADGAANQAATEAYIAALESNVEPNCGEVAAGPPQIEEQPVALEMYIRSPHTWVIRRA